MLYLFFFKWFLLAAAIYLAFLYEYIVFWFEWCFCISYQAHGDFDKNPRINLGLGFFYLIIKLPFSNNPRADFPPEYGISIHDHRFWIKYGVDRMIAIHLPGQWQWYSTHIRHNDGTWSIEPMFRNAEGFEKWRSAMAKGCNQPYFYTYVLNNGRVQTCSATYSERKREMRRYGLGWLPFCRKTRHYIHVEFSEEIGEGVHTWKGGVWSTTFTILKGETAHEAMQRMERTERFE